MIDVPPGSGITAARIIELLAPTLGWEKSAEVVDGAVAKLELEPSDLSLESALAILDQLSRTPGMVGITARFARSRLEGPRTTPVSAIVPTSPSAPPAPLPSISPPSSSGRSVAVTVPLDDIANVLASAMGHDKAREVVLVAVRRLGITRERLDKPQTMALLDELAREPGVVGLCARFGKARLILRFAA